MSGKYKVRFHLGKGKNFRHFQVTTPDGTRSFYNPEDYFLVMKNARLHNNCKVAERIHSGSNKTVCSWIICDDVERESVLTHLFNPEKVPKGTDHIELKYNPRENPHWLENGENVDFKSYSCLFTEDHRVFVGIEE